jgi:glycosyltransferase involved in cell wall biosynthesis
MISLGILAKNEEKCIGNAIQNMRPWVSEIVIVDDHSTDKTKETALDYGASQIITLPFNLEEKGFADAANFMANLTTNKWFIWIDADETIDRPELLHTLINNQDINAWALPRRKWLKYPTQREEYEAYPDWQVRLYKRIPENYFIGQMHIRFQGPHCRAYKGPHVEHMQTENRNKEKIEQRKELYNILGKKQNVAIIGGHIKEVI